MHTSFCISIDGRKQVRAVKSLVQFSPLGECLLSATQAGNPGSTLTHPFFIVRGVHRKNSWISHMQTQPGTILSRHSSWCTRAVLKWMIATLHFLIEMLRRLESWDKKFADPHIGFLRQLVCTPETDGFCFALLWLRTVLVAALAGDSIRAQTNYEKLCSVRPKTHQSSAASSRMPDR